MRLACRELYSGVGRAAAGLGPAGWASAAGAGARRGRKPFEPSGIPRQGKPPSTIKPDAASLRLFSLPGLGLALALAHRGRLSGWAAERRGRRRLLFAFSRHAGDEDAAHPSQRP